MTRPELSPTDDALCAPSEVTEAAVQLTALHQVSIEQGLTTMKGDNVLDEGSVGSGSWDFPTLALVWDPRTKAIIAGADALEALTEVDRERSLARLRDRVWHLTRPLDDGWLVATAFFMVDDLYKSYFHEFRWTSGVQDYIEATAGVFMEVLAERGFVLHFVVDSTQPNSALDELLTFLPGPFAAAGFLVTGPQLMALRLMEQQDGRTPDVNLIADYRQEGHDVADRLVAQCHEERRSSVYLNVDLDDDEPALWMWPCRRAIRPERSWYSETSPPLSVPRR